MLFSVCLVSGLLASARAEQPARGPDLVLKRTIRFSDFHKILAIPFQVPGGAQRISVKLDYSQQDHGTALDVGLMGPSGFRGWSGGDKTGFTLSLSDATPSYLPGPIEPGAWTLLLGVPNIRSNVVSQFVAQVYFDRGNPQEATDPLLTLHLRPGPAWYRGDLHMHTAHSDGFCTSQLGQKVPCPLFRSVESAESRGLDFIAITDHNTQSHYDSERELQPYFDNLLLLPGREITTYNGHANLFGATGFLDFRIGTRDTPDLNSMLRRVAGLGAIISINHPVARSGEECMGCGWTPVTTTDYRLISAVEVVNGPHADGAASGVPFWQELLNRGYHLTAIGGSDNHDANIAVPGPGSIGYPTTVVWAGDLSTPSILDGLHAGHVFIDTEGTRDRLLEYSASAGGHTAAMGDTLVLPEGARIRLAVHAMHVKGSHLEVIADGQAVPIEDAALREDDQRTTLELIGEGRWRWIRLDVCSPGGHRVLIGNPIYLVH